MLFYKHGFADDHQLIKQFIVQLQTKALGKDIVSCLNHIQVWMNQFFLRLNPTKTKILVVAPPNIQSEISIHGIFLGNKCIRFVSSAKNLGIVLDDELCFKSHINNVVKASFSILKKLTQVKGYFSQQQLKQLVSSDIFTRLDYCNSLFFGIHSELIHRMQKVQNYAARLVSKLKLPSRSLDKFFLENHWLKIRFRPIYKIILIIHKCLHHNAPKDIQNMLLFGDSSCTLHLRETPFNNKYGKRAFSHAGPKIWNCLPMNIRTEKKTEKFKKELKTFLMLGGDDFLVRLDQS